MSEIVTIATMTAVRGGRRAFLRQLAIGAVVPLLAACTSAVPSAGPTPAAPAAGGAVATSKPAGGKVSLPAYIPIELAKPDLAPTAAGVDPGYQTFPKNLVKSVQDVPGRGGDVTAFTRVILAAPPPLEENTAWQAVNKAL